VVDLDAVQYDAEVYPTYTPWDSGQMKSKPLHTLDILTEKRNCALFNL
jgi:hypothetical protein